jgi:pSer/pThr/pTyr-binding forkhead associated (FHA) protein
MPILALIVDGVATQKFPLSEGLLRIGRNTANEVQIDDLAVSSAHAVVEVESNPYMDGMRDYYIRDLDSTNGTFVNGERIQRHLLQPDDVIQIGWNRFKFIDERAGGFERTAYIVSDDERT